MNILHGYCKALNLLRECTKLRYYLCIVLKEDLFKNNKDELEKIVNMIIILDKTFNDNHTYKYRLDEHEPWDCEYTQEIKKDAIYCFCESEVKDVYGKAIAKCVDASGLLSHMRQSKLLKQEKDLIFITKREKVTFSSKKSIFYFATLIPREINSISPELWKHFLKIINLLECLDYEIFPIAIFESSKAEEKFGYFEKKYRFLKITNKDEVILDRYNYDIVSYKKEYGTIAKFRSFISSKKSMSSRNLIENNEIAIQKSFIDLSSVSEIIPVVPRSGSKSTQEVSETGVDVSKVELNHFLTEDADLDLTKPKSLIIMDYDLAFVEDNLKRVINKHSLTYDDKITLYAVDTSKINDYSLVLLFLHQKGRFNEKTIDKAKEIAKKYKKGIMYLVYFHLENHGFDPLDLVNSDNDMIPSIHINYETRGELSMDTQITFRLNPDNFIKFEKFIKGKLEDYE